MTASVLPVMKLVNVGDLRREVLYDVKTREGNDIDCKREDDGEKKGGEASDEIR